MKTIRPLSAGLIILVALTVTTLLSCATVPATPESEFKDVRYELVEWARLAQNAHNVQPWRIILDEENPAGMTLYVDTSRPLPETDPLARQITISTGTFLAVLEARAAQLGYETEIALFPRGSFDMGSIGELPVAKITLTEVGAAAEAAYPVAADPDAISTPTVKYRYRPAELGRDDLRRIEAYGTDSVAVTVITEPEEVAWLDELSIEAFTLEMETEATLMESYDLTRMNARQRRNTPYGLSLAPNFPARTLWFIDGYMTLFPQRPESYGQAGARIFASAMDDVTHYIMMVSSDNSRRSQVESGMILQAIWMELHALDHLALPNSQALQEYPEMEELYNRIHRRYTDQGETVQMLLAVARPRGGRHRWGPRLSPEALIVSSPVD